ncbi:hypothetical protein ACFWVC_15815 [Streptomyces sp. NPDC058691]|uniref:hypothetical protein n=1 Tax=Streptomyces sp. NPDC058691 TaxID=3346601 RepID=UPI0036673051
MDTVQVTTDIWLVAFSVARAHTVREPGGFVPAGTGPGDAAGGSCRPPAAPATPVPPPNPAGTTGAQVPGGAGRQTDAVRRPRALPPPLPKGRERPLTERVVALGLPPRPRLSTGNRPKGDVLDRRVGARSRLGALHGA